MQHKLNLYIKLVPYRHSLIPIQNRKASINSIPRNKKIHISELKCDYLYLTPYQNNKPIDKHVLSFVKLRLFLPSPSIRIVCWYDSTMLKWFLKFNDKPRQSKPGPKLALVAGTEKFKVTISYKKFHITSTFSYYSKYYKFYYK